MATVVSALHIYPVKGCRGIAVPSAEVDALGLVGDRRFLITDITGKFLTQRSHPVMALIGTALTPDTLTLTFKDRAPLAVRRTPDPAAPLLTVEIWSSAGLQAEDCGDEAAAWLSAVLGLPVRLVRIGSAFHRPVKPSKAQPGDVVSFADGYPLLIVGTASLAELNDHLIAQGEAAMPMDRFRPNVVVDGAAPHAEDTWPRIRIGNVVLRAAGDCVRCIVITTDQATTERGPEPLRTLARYRRQADGNGVRFGQNLIQESKAGMLRVGDPVELL
ncbi:MOSC domain-containing protein [Opitutaceae bacterium]